MRSVAIPPVIEPCTERYDWLSHCSFRRLCISRYLRPEDLLGGKSGGRREGILLGTCRSRDAFTAFLLVGQLTCSKVQLPRLFLDRTYSSSPPGFVEREQSSAGLNLEVGW